jgi:hypothetical protein
MQRLSSEVPLLTLIVNRLPPVFQRGQFVFYTRHRVTFVAPSTTDEYLPVGRPLLTIVLFSKCLPKKKMSFLSNCSASFSSSEA